jgi:hypothetical protein
MSIKSSYPKPPEYYKSYTNEVFKKQNTEQHLLPPEPIEGDFTVFGQVDNINIKLASLEEFGIAPLTEGPESITGQTRDSHPRYH